MFPFLIGVGIGVLVDELIHSSDKKSKDKSPSKGSYFVFVRSDDFGKSMMSFDGFKSAKTMFDKLKSAKEVAYKDIVYYDDSERSLYDRWKSEGNIGKEGFPSGLNQKSKLQELSYGYDLEDFESIEFSRRTRK
jgi:hypothetical protein